VSAPCLFCAVREAVDWYCAAHVDVVRSDARMGASIALAGFVQHVPAARDVLCPTCLQFVESANRTLRA
jgi:hypothetical protein